MYVTVNTIKVPAPAAAKMLDAFRKSAPDMKQVKGFVGFELWQGEDGTILAIAKWDSKEASEEYPRSEMFRRHHAGVSSSDMQAGAQMAYYNGEVVV
ncbi:MAG TPA: antibiotic biosynthesis monooxygenase family protein [Chloroflexota bacterium]|nr:antibiotic biosynthesis monooxygenase family protein [Chloroflexota bacterium]